MAYRYYSYGRFDTNKTLLAETIIKNSYSADPEDHDTRDKAIKEIRDLELRVRELEDFCQNFKLTGWEA